MKRVLAGIAALVAVTGAASAADLDGTGGVVYASKPAIWTGWVITGAAGIANHNFDTRRTINGELSKFSVDRKGEDRKTACREPYQETENWKDWCGTDFTADDTIDPARYELPLASSHFARSEEMETSGFQAGVELGRRIQSGGVIWEGAIGINFDTAGKETSTYDTIHAITIDPDGHFGGPFPIDPDDFALTGEGTLSVKKKRDIYAVVGVGMPLGEDQRFAIGARGGLVLGFFNVSGSHTFDGDDGTFSTAFNESENAIGLLFEPYARYKIDENWDIGLLGSFKWFRDIEAGDSAEKDFPFGEGGDHGLVARVNDSVTVDPSEWAIKGTLTYTIN